MERPLKARAANAVGLGACSQPRGRIWLRRHYSAARVRSTRQVRARLRICNRTRRKRGDGLARELSLASPQHPHDESTCRYGAG